MNLRKLALALMAAAALCVACDDDDNDNPQNPGQNEDTPSDNPTTNPTDDPTKNPTDDPTKDPAKPGKINHQDKWIGSACSCQGKTTNDGDGCSVASIPVPLPQNTDKVSGKVINCDNVDMTGIEGGELVCIRSIPADYKDMAPITYFPQGYCSVAAVSCENSSFCFAANYGDPSKMTKCPAGSTMISTVFNYDIMFEPAIIVEKMCAKTCETDADCNVEGKISCLERKGHKFCYNEKNFEFLGDPEKINYVDF